MVIDVIADGTNSVGKLYFSYDASLFPNTFDKFMNKNLGTLRSVTLDTFDVACSADDEVTVIEKF